MLLGVRSEVIEASLSDTLRSTLHSMALRLHEHSKTWGHGVLFVFIFGTGVLFTYYRAWEHCVIASDLICELTI